APQKIAVDRAWSLYLAIHTDVDPADARRCTLDRHLQQRWDFGEKDLEELRAAAWLICRDFPAMIREDRGRRLSAGSYAPQRSPRLHPEPCLAARRAGQSRRQY